MEKTEQSKKAENIIISMIDYIEESTEHDDSIVTEGLVSRIERLLVVLKEKRERGCRVKIITIGSRLEHNRARQYYSSTLKLGQKGTLIHTDNGDALVKFDNFELGHNGSDYYLLNDLPYDPDDKSHWWIPIKFIEKIEEDQVR